MNHVNFLSDALDGLGRWYVAVPPFLIISFLAALFFVTGEGQARLQEAGERLQKSAAREHSIDELQTALTRCVDAERAFLLTGDQRYIPAYNRDVGEIEPRLDTLRLAYAGSDSGLSAMRDLQVLTGKRLADLSMILAIQQSQGNAAAVALVKTSAGSDTDSTISDILDRLRDSEGVEHHEAAAHWANSLALSRWITLCGTIFNMLLVGIATRLVYLDMRRRAALTRGAARSEVAAGAGGRRAHARIGGALDAFAKCGGTREGQSGARAARRTRRIAGGRTHGHFVG